MSPPVSQLYAGSAPALDAALGSPFVTVLIAIWGASPGVGKSTLCAGLEFQATGVVELDTLLTASARFVGAILASADDVVVADALVPFVPSLLAWGHSDRVIGTFIAGLAEILAPVGPVLVYLDGSAEAGLARAARRDGPQWLDGYIGKLARYQVRPRVRDLASAARYLRRERAVTLAAARRQGWGIVRVDRATELTPGQVLRIVRQGLRRWI